MNKTENAAFKNDENKTASSDESCAAFSIQELVDNTDGADIRAFLIDVLTDDPMLLQQFKLKMRGGISSDDLKIYEQAIDRIGKCYADKYGYISYYESRGFHNELSEFLQKTITEIIDNKEYINAFQLIRYVFIALGNIAIDDSNGTLGALACDCITLLQTILERCDPEVKKILYRECKSLMMGDDTLDYLQDYIEELFFSDFPEEEFLRDKLVFSEAQVEAFLHSEEDCIDEYAAETWAKYHLQVMRQLNFSQKDIDAYCKKYIDLSDIRKYYVDECIRMKRYEEAIQLLEEGKLADTGYRGLILAYSEKLKEIYAQTGQREKYKDELWRSMLEYDPGDIDTYKELKTYYTADEWEEKREIIFKQKDIYSIDHLYAYDGLYDRLLKLALEARGIYYILEYEDLIKDLAPEKILKRYEEVVREKAAYTSDRGVYQEIADLLKRMKRYPGGEDLVQTLIAEFRSAYRRRPAMMQELNRV
ncbi:hypothetical protein HMPREF1221_00637 [Treponema socranskii subsp. paredis ATCC 35535]|nr:hypothetical protein HMPREF1221_00637 [Treponema socranskii subsp. paredis ATCC 35535]